MPRVKFSDVIDAFDFVSSGSQAEHEAYVCRESGKTYRYSDMNDELDELPVDIDDPKYLAIPHKNELDLGNRLVFRFTDEFLPADAARVRDLFRRRGAYARFKGLLQERRMLERWYEYEQTAQKAALKEWCKANELEFDE